MNKQEVTKMFKGLQKELVKRSPEILTGLGIAGMITTTVLAVKATPKVHLLLDDARREKGEALTTPEKIKVGWKPYVPAAVTGAVSITCLIGATSVNARRNAALATAYQLSTTALSEYKEKVVETIGEKKEQVIREKIAQDKVDKDPVESKNVYLIGNGKQLCYDPQFGQYFESDKETIRAAVNNINYEMISSEYASVNDFYDELGIDHINMGDELGWNISKDGKFDVDLTTAFSKDGRPCIVLNYTVAPKYNYWKYN